ncbi:MAG: class I SAM-dependent methyltransferase [Leptolyngbyaceae bacterium]|nr:class I SAM-dependent methyltransferase [Leptolyngbyaceae bacterium]
MSNRTLNLTNDLYDYLLSVSLRELDCQRKLREETAQHSMGQMQISPEQGQFMALLVQLMGAKKALEIGVFTGYSALSVALALPDDGTLLACDVSEEYTAIAQRYWQEADVAHKIDLRIAPAIKTLDQLLATGEANSFDFAFIDADKSSYDDYYERSLQLLRPGGLIVIDNVLWSGRVADVNDTQKRTHAIRALNTKIHQDNRVALSVLPIGDGVTLAMKR